MTKIRNTNLASDRSTQASTFNRAARLRTLPKLTTNYLRNFRGLALAAICLMVLTVSAHAQTADISKNWTTVGSAGTVDEADVRKVFFDKSKVQMGRVVGGSTTGSTTTSAKSRALIVPQQSAVIRYNITSVDSFFVTRSCGTVGSRDVRLRVRYLTAGLGSRVTVSLIEVDLASGSETPRITFVSKDQDRSANYQVKREKVCGRPWNFDFEKKAYYIEATLTTGSSPIALSAAGIQMIMFDNVESSDTSEE